MEVLLARLDDYAADFITNTGVGREDVRRRSPPW